MSKRTLTAKKSTIEDSFEESLDTIMQDTEIEHTPSIYRSVSTSKTARSIAPKAIQLNIQLNGADAGIQLAKRLADECNIPFVLLNTDSNNRSTAEASVTVPNNYLNSPKEALIDTLSESVLRNGSKEDLKSTIENQLPIVSDSIFLKDMINYVKVPFQNIDFVKSDGNYIEIHWGGKKNVFKKTLKSIQEKLPSHLFFQVHKSYIINIDKISSIGPTRITVNKQEIPISKDKKRNLLNILNIVC